MKKIFVEPSVDVMKIYTEATMNNANDEDFDVSIGTGENTEGW